MDPSDGYGGTRPATLPEVRCHSRQLRILLTYSARGIIPAEPPKKPAAEDNIETAQKSSNLDSEDEEIDPEELKRGDLEG